MHRFFLPHADLSLPIVRLTDKKEIHHLKNVLRLRSNAPIILFDGKGQEATGKIDAISETEIQIHIQTTILRNTVGQFHSVLACAIPKKAKFESIIEKCTELGVEEIVPLQTSRTEVILKGDQADKKAARYRTVAINAAKQSQRNTIPQIHRITEFSDYLRQIQKEDTVFIPCLSEKSKKLTDEFKKILQPRRVIFLIGPEGDFTPEEVAAAVAAGCIPVTLGPTVLKVDTAAISVIACANLFFTI